MRLDQQVPKSRSCRRWNYAAREPFVSHKGTALMDKQTRHELWIVGAAALAPIPLLTAIALIAALQ